VCALGVGALNGRTKIINHVPFEMTPSVLEARTIEILEDLGYANDFADTAAGFGQSNVYLTWLIETDAAPERWEALGSGRPAVVTYWWRGSPSTFRQMIVGVNPAAIGATRDNPANIGPGMVLVELDTLGRLLRLEAVPDRVAEAAEGGAEAEWNLLFDAAGLDMGDFVASSPRFAAPHFADTRAAWEGVYPEDPAATLRIEAASLAGRPVSFRMFSPFEPIEGRRSAADLSSTAQFAAFGSLLTLTFVAIFGSIFVAFRNLRSGRGDRRGARRLGWVVALTVMAQWLLSEHTLTVFHLVLFLDTLTMAVDIGGFAWTLYLACEPFLRRHSPESLIGWTRMLEGRWSDPLVGRDVLLGCATGTALSLMTGVPAFLAGAAGLGTELNAAQLPATSLAEVLSRLATALTNNVLYSLGIAFLFGLAYVVLGRRRWFAYCVMLVAASTVTAGVPGAGALVSIVIITLAWAVELYVLLRHGILAFFAMFLVGGLLSYHTANLRFSAWYSTGTITTFMAVFSFAAYAFYRCVDWKLGYADALLEE